MIRRRLPNRFNDLLCAVAVVVMGAGLLCAQQTETLADFVSKEGRFSIRLPQEPQTKQIKVAPDTIQHQFGVDLGGQGAIIVSYQDTPNLAGASDATLQAALKNGRDALVKSFKGQVRSEEKMLLEELHPGLDVQIDMPDEGGMAHCRLFIVGKRLYQILIPGIPRFVQSDEIEEVLASFQLLAP